MSSLSQRFLEFRRSHPRRGEIPVTPCIRKPSPVGARAMASRRGRPAMISHPEIIAAIQRGMTASQIRDTYNLNRASVRYIAAKYNLTVTKGLPGRPKPKS